MSILVEILRKISIFILIFQKSRIWSKFAKHFDLGQNFCKSRFLVEIFENLDFVRSFENLDVGRKFRKISILVEILKKNLDFDRNLKKISNLVEFSKFSNLVEVFQKIFILVKIFENIDFGLNFRKLTILVEIFENRDFGRNFRTSIFSRVTLYTAGQLAHSPAT